ncbi:Scr1 family TA system antitoxin-like transcriptional regulator [Kibdelosporangium phytohabitans]|uniref:Scr1 family TA system antitoxin-like transcriptional regulator n=1 Tax=Kibdelosporangium phytohabitans TaxID=860235 RepID=UPI0019F5B1AC|nr:Scr1 family TA system antitoxin-like transcriptional regulator [Kibdelosporangium phytohabitans]MBE1462887.1 hypothetical protein [Kibdelosporangium phytohabitans]
MRDRFCEPMRSCLVLLREASMMQARMKRQELLYRQDKRFHFVVTESALRVRRVDRGVMLAQLDRLVSLSTLPNVRSGSSGSRLGTPVGPRHGFWLRDDKQVSVETYSAALRLTQSAEIDLHGEVFEHLSAIASYDRAARAIITRLADDLAAEVSPGDE